MSIKNNVLIVTGGSRGIGAAVSILAAKQGFDVCINYHSNEKKATEVAQIIKNLGRNCMIYKADLAVEFQLVKMFAAVDKTLGRITALVNNGGVNGRVGKVESMAGDDIRNVFETNVLGAFICCREAVLRMSTNHGGQGGAIVNLSSAAARLGAAGRNIHYAASKRAVEALTFGLAQEVASEGVRVNAVSPGMIETEMHEPGRLEKFGPKLPMGRPGTVEEVASAVLWLLSDDATYVSGTVVDVSGAR